MRYFKCEGKTLQSMDRWYNPVAMIIVLVLLKSDSLTGLALAVPMVTVHEAMRNFLCMQEKDAGVRGMGVVGVGVGVGVWEWYMSDYCRNEDGHDMLFVC